MFVLNLKPVCEYLRLFNEESSYEGSVFYDFLTFSSALPKANDVLRIKSKLNIQVL